MVDILGTDDLPGTGKPVPQPGEEKPDNDNK